MAVEPGPLLTRVDRAFARAATWLTHCQEIAEYLVPDKNVITRLGGNEGEKRMDRIFDTTGPEAHGLLKATMQGALTPSTMRWFGLKTRDEDLNDVYEVQTWLEDVEDRIRLALGQSNFYSEQLSAYGDRIAFGMSAMCVEEKPKPPRGLPWGGLLFRTLTPGEYAVEEGRDGMVDTLFRRFEWSARNIVAEWPTTASDSARTLAEQRPDDKLTIIHAVYPRTSSGRRRDVLGMPWASVYLEKQTKVVLAESGYPQFRYVVPRWDKLSGETYGRGPGMMALPGLKTLNKLTEMDLEGVALAIRPPRWALEDGIVGDLDLTPDGLTMFSLPNAAGHMENESRYDISDVRMKQMQDDIRRLFFWEQLQLVKGRTMTATEAEIRWNTMRQILGPTIERQNAEDLTPIIAVVFEMMLAGGVLPPVPEALLEADLDIVFDGPLARSTKVQRIAGMEQVVAHLTQLAAIDPAAAIERMDNLDPDASFRDLCEITGLPPSYMRATEQRDEIRAARTQRQMQDRQMAGFEQAANIAKGAAPMLKALQAPQEDMAAA